MIPYVAPPVVRALGQELSAFALLVAAAVAVGHQLAIRRATRLGFDRDLAWRVVTWTVGLGLVGSHLGAILLYEPRRALEEPLVLLAVWGAMSSTGGVLGGVAGCLWAMRRAGLDRLRRLAFLEAVAFAFPFAWLFGRAGCALAHDHLGLASTSFLAVAFPSGGRLDLGLLELLWTAVMAALWLVLDRHPRPPGFFLAAWLLLYAPVRLVLDALRTEDPRLLLGLTGAQLASVGGVTVGAVLALRLVRGRRPAVATPAGS